MAFSTSSPLQRPPTWLRALLSAPKSGGQRRLRLALYLAFLALGLGVCAQGYLAQRQETLRAADAEILDLAGQQRLRTQQIGSQASLLVAEPLSRAHHAQILSELLSQSVQDALLAESLLARQMQRSGGTATVVAPALEAWQAARERLWYRGQSLLRLAEQDPDDDLVAGTALLRAETAGALSAAQQLSAALRGAADLRAQSLSREMNLGVLGMLALLGLLALAVVEPSARAVARHARQLHEQSAGVRNLALVAEHTSALVLISGRDDQLQWVNAAFEKVTGWPLQEVLGRTPYSLLTHASEDPVVHQRVAQAVRLGHGLRHEWLRRARDGRDLWLDIDLRPVHDTDGQLTGFVRVATDVTARVQQQTKLQTLWAALPAGVVVQSETGTIVDGNRAAEKLLGMSMAQMQGLDTMDPRWRAVREDLSPYPGEEFPAMRTLRTGQALTNETMGVHTPDGQLRWLVVNTEPQLDSKGQVCGVITCFIDVSESRLLHQRLSSHARTDALTQLPNRSVVMERLQRAILHAQRHPGYGFAVLFMDFDRFKQVNDTLGHGAGDELLRQIAGRLQQALRPGDAVARVDSRHHVAARIGGDEFVVVLEGVPDMATVSAIAERLLADLAEPYQIGAVPLHSTASIGVVRYQAGSLPVRAPLETDADVEAAAEEILRNADTAMYEAKRAGRGRWVSFDDSMHERVVRALAVETDLRRALDNHELFVVYQPVLDLPSRRMVGLEALVRWRHPDRGLVSPIEFIGVAEECGLIDAVGAVVLHEACMQFVRWQRTLGEAAPRLLAVNLSRAQLKRAGLVEDVRAVLQEAGMAPEQLELEVTETFAAQDERVQTTLRELKGLGVRLALDDFGTGYSSLACLHLLPVDTVKIDRGFVKHAETVEYHRVLIEATIRVARTLGMTTVAEGIETEGQAALMQALECDRGQGYLFAHPLEATELENWARCQWRQQQALAETVDMG
jgi:diguanylate cyclase (GGDEF)-like protein/PAS domain S-box-containing protein